MPYTVRTPTPQEHQAMQKQNYMRYRRPTPPNASPVPANYYDYACRISPDPSTYFPPPTNEDAPPAPTVPPAPPTTPAPTIPPEPTVPPTPNSQNNDGLTNNGPSLGGSAPMDASTPSFRNSNDFLGSLLQLLGGATTSQQVQVGDMAQSITGTLPTLTDFIRNLYATNVSRELGLDQNAVQRDVAGINVGGQKYVADQNLAGVLATNQNRLDILAQEQARQREREQLFQQMAAGLGAPVFRGTNALMNRGMVPQFYIT